MNLPAKYSRRSLQPLQYDDLGPSIRPCERFLHGSPTESAEPPHDVLHHPGSLLVDEPHRQQQYGLVAGILYVTQPPQERCTFRRLERRVGDDVLVTEIYLLKQTPHHGRLGIKPAVDVRHVRIGIERDNRRRMHSFHNQRPRELPRAAAGVHDTALVVERPHGQRCHSHIAS